MLAFGDGIKMFQEVKQQFQSMIDKLAKAIEKMNERKQVLNVEITERQNRVDELKKASDDAQKFIEKLNTLIN